MLRDLIRHPDYPCAIAESISVGLEWQAPGLLWLRYHAELDTEQVALPAPAGPVRQDGLWRTTCFELFVRAPGVPGYSEFNFSPSGAWAAYRFESRRNARTDLALMDPPTIYLEGSDSHLAIETRVRLPENLTSGFYELGLSAVIEAGDGTNSYWALAHPTGEPDFHAPDCFALELPSQHAA